ncbi:hypothetical protein L7F22_063288 [Adiantum nelumboides]|nr:hypothetical protein [Adiantum nelumboides]
MGTARWGLERSTDQAFMRIVEGEEGEEEDYMAGLVERIAHTMLEEDDDDGKSKTKSVWEAHSAAQASSSFWDQSFLDHAGAHPLPAPKRVESRAMELLYMELVRLKMEELAVAQHQLSLYQKALVSARQTYHCSFVSTDGLSSTAPSLLLGEQQPDKVDTPYSAPLQRQTRGGEWAHSNMMECPSSKQRLGSPVVYTNAWYPIQAVSTSSGALTLRESGGTGVFLPRCRTGARQLRTMESKCKPELHFSDSTRCAKGVLTNKRKEDIGRPTLPNFPPLQEVAPEVSLPTEWTY